MEKKYSYKDSGVSDSLRLQIKDVDGKKGIVTFEAFLNEV
jgi:hypothetical protein